jgi:hypothetical protein
MPNYSRVQGKNITVIQDKDDKELYTLLYRPETWTAATEVIQGARLYVPTAANGCMYDVTQGGITGAIEPTWTTGKNTIVDSGTAKFKSLPYSLLLQTGDVIEANIAESWDAYEFILPTGLIVDNDALIDNSIVQFRIATSPGVGKYEITCRISVLKQNGIYTRYDDIITINFT